MKNSYDTISGVRFAVNPSDLTSIEHRHEATCLNDQARLVFTTLTVVLKHLDSSLITSLPTEAAEIELLVRYPYGHVILRLGFIYGNCRGGNLELPLDVIGSPLEEGAPDALGEQERASRESWLDKTRIVSVVLQEEARTVRQLLNARSANRLSSCCEGGAHTSATVAHEDNNPHNWCISLLVGSNKIYCASLWNS
ncbi:hypothetical protein M8C21_032034, partial [Ambrosia artemisiifolia]